MNYTEKTIASKEIYHGKIINLRLDDVELPNGKSAKREVVEHPGGVAVVAITPDEEVLLVKQFRKPCEEELWEIPAGKLERGEDPAKAALRELEEETGFKAEKVEKLLSFYTSPGFADEMLHIYLADQLVPTVQSPDEDEFLSVHRKSWTEIREMLAQNELRDAKSVAGLLFVMAQRGV